LFTGWRANLFLDLLSGLSNINAANALIDHDQGASACGSSSDGCDAKRHWYNRPAHAHEQGEGGHSANQSRGRLSSDCCLHR